MNQKKFGDASSAIILLFNIIGGFGSLVVDSIQQHHVAPTFLRISSSTLLAVSRFGYSRASRGSYIKIIDLLGIGANVILLVCFLIYNLS